MDNFTAFRGDRGVVNDYDRVGSPRSEATRRTSHPPLQVTIARVNDRRELQACSPETGGPVDRDTESDEMRRDETRRNYRVGRQP